MNALFMNCKLLALDIDGTLLNDEKKVEAEVRESLRRARQSGIRIALISGRMPYAVELVEEELGFPCIKACNAGTCVILDSGKTIMDFIPVETAKEVYQKIACKYEVPLWLYRDRSWMVTAMDAYVESESRIIARKPKVMAMDLLCQLWNEQSTGPNKLLFCTDPEIISRIACDMQMFREKGLDYARSAEQYLEVFPKGATKGKALRMICEALNIRSDEVMAFGDQELDLPLLQEAGFAVVMGNAIPLLKEQADFVTKSNNEAGIAYALNQLLGI